LCHSIEDPSFRVFTVTHKFSEDFHVVHRFEKCLATPIVLPILTDGAGYVCVDKKMEEDYKLGSAYPEPENILKWWGSDAHREKLKSININRCSRCTWSSYQAQIEKVVEHDGMCLSFP
jgi:hypothetical protein